MAYAGAIDVILILHSTLGMTPIAPSTCPTALITSQFIAVYSSGDSVNPNAERPIEETGEGGIRTLG